MAVAEGSFRYHGHRIAYDVHGTGERVIVLVHGLLMNRRMYDTLAPEIASRGNRVITVDLLGHGRSDRLADRQIYSMTAFADQVLALLDHMELEAPVVGGTSLGANVGLEFAAHHPERAGALFIEMPVLEDALLGAALLFTPILLGLRLANPAFKGLAALARQIPRSY
jgi:pimeloyl-ACP methyl ester carboxylesterase